MKIILDKMYVCLFIFKLGQKKRSIELHMNSPHKLNKFTGKIVADNFKFGSISAAMFVVAK